MRVVVLMGGSSMERDVSLATGRGVARALSARGHAVVPLDPSAGRRLELDHLAQHRIGEAPPEEAEERSLVLADNPEIGKCDAVFVALHGGIGEDGTLQALLDLAGVPYTGSGMLASALAMDKSRAKTLLRAVGVPCPRELLLERHDAATDADAGAGADDAAGVDVEALGGYPVVVKPNAQGSSVGVHIVAEASELGAALDDAFQYGTVLVEEFIPGREVTVAVLDGEALPVVEIIPEAGFYDYRHKYTKGQTRYVVPAELPAEVAAEVSRFGERAFATLGCAGVARIDFRLTPENRPYFLEANTVPGMTETSLVPMAARARGISYEDLVERLIVSAVERGGARR
jgi:D-alanine-D-alanine ligase